MSYVTIRISAHKKAQLEKIAVTEKRSVQALLLEMVDEYIDRHLETMELLSNPEWAESIRLGKQEMKEGKGISLDELDD